MSDKMVIKDPVNGKTLTLHKDDWDKYMEHKKIIEEGHYDRVMAHNKKRTK